VFVRLGTLALGIAGDVIIFSVFNAFYLRPFPFKEPARLVDLDETAPRWNLEYTSLTLAHGSTRQSRVLVACGNGRHSWTLRRILGIKGGVGQPAQHDTCMGAD
jgi:hypothetical protein